MSGWLQLSKCKVCGMLPIILPAGKKKIAIGCDHGEQQVGIKTYPTAQEWNEAQEHIVSKKEGE